MHVFGGLSLSIKYKWMVVFVVELVVFFWVDVVVVDCSTSL